MDKLEEIKKYLNKLIKIITSSREISIGKYKFINKKKIDNVLCCFIAVLPIKYKQMISLDIPNEQEGMLSVKDYKWFLESIHNTFFLLPSMYMIETEVVRKCIQRLIMNLEKDIEFLAKK